MKFEDPRTKFFEEALEKGEPFFAFCKEVLGLSQATVVFGPILPFLVISVIKDLRRGKKQVLEIMVCVLLIVLIIFSQVTLHNT